MTSIIASVQSFYLCPTRGNRGQDDANTRRRRPPEGRREPAFPSPATRTHAGRARRTRRDGAAPTPASREWANGLRPDYARHPRSCVGGLAGPLLSEGRTSSTSSWSTTEEEKPSHDNDTNQARVIAIHEEDMKRIIPLHPSPTQDTTSPYEKGPRRRTRRASRGEPGSFHAARRC